MTRPDFWLSQTSAHKYVLTPCSGLGKLAFPGLDLGRNIGTGLVLTESESVFIAQVLEDFHYTVTRHNHQRHLPHLVNERRVTDTRPKPNPTPTDPSPGRLFTSHSTRQLLIAKSYRFASSKQRCFSLKAHAHLLQPL